MPKATRVVIVGGGVGGITLAKKLNTAGLTVTLITPTEYVEWAPGVLRSLVKPAEADRPMAPSVTACVKHATVVRGKATSVSSTEVVVAGPEGHVSCSYDILVIATGGRYAHSSTSCFKSPDNAMLFQERVTQVQAKAAELAAANSVTIVGGGVAGIELACEICENFPQKKVTLVSKGEIGGMLHPKVQKQVVAKLTKTPSLTLRANTLVSPDAELPADLQADQVYWTTGFTPNTEFLQGGPFAAALERGLVKVDRSTLVVDGTTNVFAIGDIITPGLMEAPFNSGYVTQQESLKLAKNVVAMAEGKPLKPMGKAAMKRGALISLGSTSGAGHFDNTVLPQCIVTAMKSKDLFRKKSVKAFQS